MTSDPRAALSTLITALERHLEASASKRGEEDPTVLAAYEDVADAFEVYDEALLTAYGEMTPLDVYDESEDADEIDDHYSDEDGDESIYSGLDDEEYDTDEEETEDETEDETGS